MSQGDEDFADRLAAATPTPGGGAAAARVGLIATSLLRMSVGLTLKKPAAAGSSDTLRAVDSEAKELADLFRRLESADVAAFDGFMAALRLPRTNDAERELRREELRTATEVATQVPLDTLRGCLRLVELARQLLVDRDSLDLAAPSDAQAAAELARGAFLTAEHNVDANLPYLGKERAERARRTRRELRQSLNEQYEGIADEGLTD